MKPTSWLIIIITILLVAALSFSLDRWASGWQGLFFYLDDWRMWIVVAIAVWVIKKIFDWVWRAEVRMLK